MTEAVSILDQVQIASPCSATWNSMSGDDRSRFCGSCQKHVYNITTMTAVEALALIQKHEGNLCIRLYRRADGTVLTTDCPVGIRAVHRRMVQLLATVSIAAAITLGGLILPNLVRAQSPTGHFGKGPVVQKVRSLWEDLLVWIGIQPPPRPIMGAVCAPMPPGNGSTGGGNDSSQ